MRRITAGERGALELRYMAHLVAAAYGDPEPWTVLDRWPADEWGIAVGMLPATLLSGRPARRAEGV